VLAAAAHAQERTAGQAYDAQVNWASLKNSIDLVSTQNKAMAAAVEVISDKLDAMSGKIDAIARCGSQKKLWNGSGCVAVASTGSGGTKPTPTPSPTTPTEVAVGGGSCSAYTNSKGVYTCGEYPGTKQDPFTWELWGDVTPDGRCKPGDKKVGSPGANFTSFTCTRVE
jgi:hypothetical protein